MDDISEIQKAAVGFQKLIEQTYKKLEEDKRELDKQKQAFAQMTKKLHDFHIGTNKVVLDIGLHFSSCRL